MNCASFDNDRTLAACGETPSEDFSEHVRICADCRDAVAESRDALRAYQDRAADPMPEVLALRLRSLHSRGPRRLLRILASAAAILLAAVLLWPAGPPPPAEAPGVPEGAAAADIDDELQAGQVRVELLLDDESRIDADLGDLGRRIAYLTLDLENL